MSNLDKMDCLTFLKRKEELAISKMNGASSFTEFAKVLSKYSKYLINLKLKEDNKKINSDRDSFFCMSNVEFNEMHVDTRVPSIIFAPKGKQPNLLKPNFHLGMRGTLSFNLVRKHKYFVPSSEQCFIPFSTVDLLSKYNIYVSSMLWSSRQEYKFLIVMFLEDWADSFIHDLAILDIFKH